ncbi:hypothetical protein [Yersinia aldovae]|uniref:hypothetical protein n=1 Tax=Yersinia aldovae TaxID=29483 RepID=UPI0006717062|nr:hypothetical protein [Yersinia aldovae]
MAPQKKQGHNPNEIDSFASKKQPGIELKPPILPAKKIGQCRRSQKMLAVVITLPTTPQSNPARLVAPFWALPLHNPARWRDFLLASSHVDLWITWGGYY